MEKKRRKPHIKIMSRLPSVSGVQNYVLGSKQVRQGGGWDKPEKSGSSSSKVLSRSKILLRMSSCNLNGNSLSKRKKLKCMLFNNLFWKYDWFQLCKFARVMNKELLCLFSEDLWSLYLYICVLTHLSNRETWALELSKL